MSKLKLRLTSMISNSFPNFLLPLLRFPSIVLLLSPSSRGWRAACAGLRVLSWRLVLQHLLAARARALLRLPFLLAYWIPFKSTEIFWEQMLCKALILSLENGML